MKIFKLLTVFVIFLALITGCSSTVSKGHAAQTHPLTTQQLMLKAVYETAPGLKDRFTQPGLIKVIKAVCLDFNEGFTFYEVVQDGMDGGLSAYQTGALIGAAVDVYCPQYKTLLPSN